ncbi:hypothetical protein JavanS354_0014 [Streptococcus satellite phage Javan354]|uniref:Uncharacterized protein n=1 Tax=Streptococcus oralis TaxID=1303 RepID=A0A139PBE9_STROR|nr:hypothetical protein [Streptococcus oralis]KXT85605.1 hypothetical protein SORDD16_01386 [Streptococcus oralis]QBX09544.1 hypothetical protein JavanS354_0014 [Streptococcus satellite phage Javan354]
MKLWEYVDKNVRLVLSDGTSIVGKVIDWFDGYDLDGYDEIVIDDYSYSESSIKEIEIVKGEQLNSRKEV